MEEFKNFNASLDCSLILSFDVFNQILAHLSGAKLHSDILVYENSEISTLTEKDISIISYLNGYVFGTFYRRLRSIPAVKLTTMLIIFNDQKMFWREFTLTRT